MPLNAAKLTRDVAMEQTPINYHLSGMILYYGIVLCIHSYQGKHYVAMCLYEYQGRFYWMECNDTKFRHFEDNASMIDHCVQAAYQPILLFYRKDEVSQNAGGNAFSQAVAPSQPTAFPDPVSASSQGLVPYPVAPTQAQGGYPEPLPVAPSSIPSGFPEPLPVAPTQTAGYSDPIPVPVPTTQGVSMNIYGDRSQEVAREPKLPLKPVSTSSIVAPYPEPTPSYPPVPGTVPAMTPKYPASLPEAVPSYPPAPVGRYSPSNPSYPGATKQNVTPPVHPQAYPTGTNYPPSPSHTSYSQPLPFKPPEMQYPQSQSHEPQYPPQQSYPPQQPQYPPQQPQYPPQPKPQEPQYPPQPKPQEPQYPAQPQYPPQPQPRPQEPQYPPQPQYPPKSQEPQYPPQQQPQYPPQQPQYPPQQPQYPPQQPQYPPQQQPQYPPPQQSQYPPQQPQYPPQQPQYPPQQPQYPPKPQQAQYPPQQPQYPPQYQYPPQSQQPQYPPQPQNPVDNTPKQGVNPYSPYPQGVAAYSSTSQSPYPVYGKPYFSVCLNSNLLSESLDDVLFVILLSSVEIADCGLELCQTSTI